MTPQETHLQYLLEQLRIRLLVMCVTVEEVVTHACITLRDGNAKLAKAVIDADNGIDALEVEVDEMAISLMARSQPVARDLRLVVSALRMVVDLERIGDEAAAIANRVLILQESSPPPALDLIEQMMVLTKKALHDSIVAFREEDSILALQVCHAKKDILQLEVQVLQKLMQDYPTLVNDKETIDKESAGWPTLHAILITRSLIRIFGCSTNIAEHSYFMTHGVSLKHKKDDLSDINVN